MPRQYTANRSRRSLLRTGGTITAAGLTAGFAGCVGGSNDQAETNGPQFSPINDAITVWHAMGGTNGETLTAIGDEFEADTGTEVTMEYQDSYENVLTNTLAAFDSGTVADMFQVDSLFAQQVLDTEQVKPVEEILPDSFDAGQFLTNVTDFFTIDGTLASLPFNNSNAIMYLNRDAFEAAGLDPDDPPTTLSEVRAASEALVNEGVTQFGITWPNHVWFIEHWYSFAGELIVDAENGHAGTPSEFRTPDSIYDFYEWWQGMANDGLYTNPGIEAWGEATSLFVEQEVGMLLTSTASVAGLIADSEDFDVDAAPYPSISDTRVGPVIGGASFYVPAGLSSDRYDKIGQFLAHVAQPNTQITWHKGSGYYPITEPAIAQLEAENWFTDNPMYGVALEQLRASDTENPATKRMLLGPAREVQTTIQNKSVEIINADDIEAEIETMKTDVDETLANYYN